MDRLDRFLALSSALMRTREHKPIAEVSASGILTLVPALTFGCIIWQNFDPPADLSPYTSLFQSAEGYVDAVAYLDPATTVPPERIYLLVAALYAQWRSQMFHPLPMPETWTVDQADIRAVAGNRGTIGQLYMCPIATADATYGALLVGAVDAQTFDNATTHLLVALAEQAAIAFENATLYSRTRRNVEESEALNEIARAIGASLNIAELFNTVVYHTRRMIPFETAGLALINDDGETLDFVQSWARAGHSPPHGTRLLLAGTPIGQAIYTRDLTIIHSATVPALLAANSDRTQMIVPLIAKRRVLGAFVVGSSRADAFERAAHHRLFERIGDHLAIAIDNSRLFEATQHAADYDNRLGVYNRDYFDRQLPQLAERTVFSHSQMGLLLVDMDHLKYINDTYGHMGGDAALRLTAKAIRASVRTSDIVCRYGGDEFVVLLPACTLDGLAAVAVKILRIIHSIDRLLVVDARDDTANEYVGDFLAIDSADLHQLRHDPTDATLLSVSIGGALLPDSAPTALALLDRADSALYNAKESGRNRANIVSGADGTSTMLDAAAAVNLDRTPLTLNQSADVPPAPPATLTDGGLQSRLLSFIGHELRTPLSIIYSYAQIMRDRLPAAAEFDRLRTMADKTVAQGDTIVAMIEELLEASRLQQSRLSLDLSDVDLDVLLEHALMHLDLVDPSRVCYIERASNTPLVVIADEQRLERALLTLMDMGISAANLARRHRALLDDAPPTSDTYPDVLLWLQHMGESVRLDIYLPSVEVANDAYTHLFDLTRAVSDTDTSPMRAGAVGLGLYVARGVVELQGGSLTAVRPTCQLERDSIFAGALKTYEAADGTLPGTLFTLWLPLKNHARPA